MDTPDTPRYRAFLSYSHLDRQWCERIHRAVERYRVPQRLVGLVTGEGPVPPRLAPVFRDRDDLGAAESLSVEIETALKASRFLLVLCSPGAAQSRWVNREIIRFKQLHGEGRVLAAIVDGDPASDDPAVQCFPAALRFRLQDNGDISSEAAETLAADFRPGGDGFRHGLLKLAAGLIGVRLDDLVQREAQRRSLRVRVATAVLSLLVVAFAGIAWEALRQRDAARLAQVEAIDARDGAETLIELILTDLKNDVQAFGKLASLTAIGERAAAYYDDQVVTELTADQLGRRSRVLLMLGEADNLRGNLDAALANYQAASATTAEQLHRDGDNTQRMFDHSQSLFWVGDIAWQRGETDAAREAFSGYHTLAKRLVALEPDNDAWQLELKYAISNLGTLARDSGETDEAQEYFRQAVSLSQALLEKAPEDVERRLSAGTARAWLADTLVDQLLLQQAIEQRRQELEVYAAGLALHPEDTRLLLQEATAHRAAGSLAVHLGDLDAALVEATTAVAIQQRLSELDSDSAERAEFTALARSLLGEVLFYLGEFSESETALTRAISDGEALLRGDPDQVLWRRELDARPRWILARLAYQNSPSDVGRAVSLATSALETMSSLRQSSPNDANVRRAFGLALQAAIEIGAQPTTRWSEIQALFDEQDSRAEHQLLLARARLETGQPEKAIGPVRRLQAAGYRHPDFRALLARYPQADAARHESVDPTATPPATRSIP